MVTTKERLDKHDREIAAIRALLRQGMRMLAQVAAVQKRTDTKLERLVTAQAQTDASLKAFIGSLRRAGNGHSKTRVH